MNLIMEERKTAAYVLSIVALIAVLLFVVLPYRNLHKTYTLSFKTCTVSYKFRYNVDTAEDSYHVAQNELGLCLCNGYVQKPDIITKKKIIALHKSYGHTVCPDTINYAKYNNLDSIIKYRDIAFDPKIMWD